MLISENDLESIIEHALFKEFAKQAQHSVEEAERKASIEVGKYCTETISKTVADVLEIESKGKECEEDLLAMLRENSQRVRDARSFGREGRHGQGAS